MESCRHCERMVTSPWHLADLCLDLGQRFVSLGARQCVCPFGQPLMKACAEVGDRLWRDGPTVDGLTAKGERRIDELGCDHEYVDATVPACQRCGICEDERSVWQVKASPLLAP